MAQSTAGSKEQIDWQLQAARLTTELPVASRMCIEDRLPRYPNDSQLRQPIRPLPSILRGPHQYRARLLLPECYETCVDQGNLEHHLALDPIRLADRQDRRA